MDYVNLDIEEYTSWEHNKNSFSNNGKRPNFSTNIEITPEMEEAYNASKKKILNHRIVIAIVVGIFIFFNIFHIQGVGMGLFIVALFVGMLFFRVRQFSKDAELEQEYIENCVNPLANQILPEMKVERDIEIFPLYGRSSLSGVREMLNNRFQDNGVLASMAKTSINTRNHAKLGHFLEQRCVIPKFNDDFDTGFVLDTLTNNKEGFLFTNAHATSEYSDGDGHRQKVTEFKGPIVVMRMSHAVRSGVGLYTTKTSSILKREKSNGYVKVSTIDTENEEFNRNFEVMAKEDSQAFFVLSPLVMEKLMGLKEKYGSFGMYVEEDYMIFGFNINRKMLAMPEKVKDAKNMNIKSTAKELVELLEMIYDFKDAVDLNFDTQL